MKIVRGEAHWQSLFAKHFSFLSQCLDFENLGHSHFFTSCEGAAHKLDTVSLGLIVVQKLSIYNMVSLVNFDLQ